MKILVPGDRLCCNDGKPHIFLAGPTPRNEGVKSWRPEALEILEKKNYRGLVSVPEPFIKNSKKFYGAQIKWEAKHLEMATCIMFWIPRDLETMPGFTTNIEFGEWYKSGKVVLGYPENAPKMRYLQYKASHICTFSKLDRTVDFAMMMATGNAL